MNQTLNVQPLKLKSLNEGSVVSTSRGERTFTPNTRPPAPEEPPPPPTFSEADLKQAERDGFQKGFLEGIKSGREQAENEQAAVNKQVAAMAAKFEASTMPLFSHYTKVVTQLNEHMHSFALALAKKVAGDALESNAEKRVAEIAARACVALTGESRLTIAVHESLGDALETLLKPLAARLPEHTEIIILRDPTMPLADCRIEWKLGRLDYTVEDMWKRVEETAVQIAAKAQKDVQADLAALPAQMAAAPAAPEQTAEEPTDETPAENPPEEVTPEQPENPT